MVLLERNIILLGLGQPGLGVLVARSADLHGHDHFRYIVRFVPGTEDAQHHVIVRRDTEPLVVLAHLVIHCLAHIHRRVRRHPTVLETTRVKRITLPMTHHAVSPAILQIAIHHIRPGGGKSGCDMFDGIGRKQHIVGVQEPDHIAGRHADAFIDGIVNALIFFRHPPHVRMQLGITLYHLFRSVRRSAIHDDVLYVRIRLPLHARQCPLHRLGAVVGNGYNRYFHGINCVYTFFTCS